MASPSVCAGGTWKTTIESPFRWNDTVSVNVTTGSAPGGEAGSLRVQRLDELVGRHPLADVFVREDQRAGLAHVLVAAGVIEVPVRVEHEPHGLRRDRLDGGEDLRRQRRELVVDDERRVIADDEPNVPARADEHVYRAGDRRGRGPERCRSSGRAPLQAEATTSRLS